MLVIFTMTLILYRLVSYREFLSTSKYHFIFFQAVCAEVNVQMRIIVLYECRHLIIFQNLQTITHALFFWFQFLNPSSECNSLVMQLKHLASKVIFALSLNNFTAVFNRISGRQADTKFDSQQVGKKFGFRLVVTIYSNLHFCHLLWCCTQLEQIYVDVYSLF